MRVFIIKFIYKTYKSNNKYALNKTRHNNPDGCFAKEDCYLDYYNLF